MTNSDKGCDTAFLCSDCGEHHSHNESEVAALRVCQNGDCGGEAIKQVEATVTHDSSGNDMKNPITFRIYLCQGCVDSIHKWGSFSMGTRPCTCKWSPIHGRIMCDHCSSAEEERCPAVQRMGPDSVYCSLPKGHDGPHKCD